MTAAELDKFYSLGNVEGVAFVDHSQVLVENQLLVSEDVAVALAQSFTQIFSGLAGANRPCKGFIVRTTKNQFLGIPTSIGVVILQLNPLDKVDTYFEEAVSIIGKTSTGTVTDPAAQVVVSQPARPGQVEQPAAAEAEEGLEELAEVFGTKMVGVLAKVAPKNLAKKIYRDSIQKTIGADGPFSSREQLVAIGRLAVSSVPNAGRRKLVETELDSIIKQLGL